MKAPALSGLRKQQLAAEQAVRLARNAEAAALKRSQVADSKAHLAKSRFEGAQISRSELDSAIETARQEKAKLVEARSALADEEAHLRDAMSAMDNLTSDLIQTGRVDDHLEALIQRLIENSDPDPLQAALIEGLRSLQILRFGTGSKTPEGQPSHPAHEALAQCVNHLLDLMTRKPDGAEKLFKRNEGAVYLPRDAAGQRGGASARDHFKVDGIPVFFRGRSGETSISTPSRLLRNADWRQDLRGSWCPWIVRF
jgi:hypothetical protein